MAAALTSITAATTAKAQDAQQFVAEAVKSELAADANDHSRWIYYETDSQPGNSVKQWVAETAAGNLKRVLVQNGQSVPEGEQRSRMSSFVTSSSDQAKQRKNGQHDDAQAAEMLKTLPRAFLWTKVSDENGETTLHFKPDPAFHAPNYEERVFAAMEGEMIVTDEQHRIARLKGTLIHDVKFLGGLLGYLNAGGTFDVKRSETGKGLWQITDTHIQAIA